MKLKYTFGPWKYTVSKIHGRHQISESKNGNQICAIWSRGKETTEANARLISCTPEMLEFLISDSIESIKMWEDSCFEQGEEFTFDKWKTKNIIKVNLIEKATGLKIEEAIRDDYYVM